MNAYEYLWIPMDTYVFYVLLCTPMYANAYYPCISMHSFAGTPSLRQCQWLKRYFSDQGAGARIDTINDLRCWASTRQLPPSFDMLLDSKLYVVPVRYEDYPDTDGIIVVCKKGIGWLLQKSIAGNPCVTCVHDERTKGAPLCRVVGANYTISFDGKHKLHHGKWIFVTAGVHCPEMNTKGLVSHSFRPVVHFFGKQQENKGSMLMLLDALSLLTQRFSGYALVGSAAPHSGCWDRSTGFLAGWIHRYPTAKFITCWPHIIRKVKSGEYMSRLHQDFETFEKDVQVCVQ